MRMSIRRALAGAGVVAAASTGTLVVDAASPDTASASAGNRLCNNQSSSTALWAEVLEVDGSVFKVYPHDCSPSSPGINFFRAPVGWSVYYKYAGASNTQPLKRCARWDATQAYWCNTNGWSIDVISVKPN